MERHIATLALGSSFDQAELKAAHRKLIMQWHPDNFPLDSSANAEATEKAKAINSAFEFLQKYLEKNGGVYPALPANVRAGSAPARNESPPARANGNRTYAAGFPDPTVEEIFLNSPPIISAGYNPLNAMLYLKFKGGIVHRYSSVPASLYEAFLLAPSQEEFCRKYLYYRFSNIRY